MTTQEMEAKVREAQELVGAEIVIDRRGNIQVGQFGKTANWKVAKATLEALGFDCGPNYGFWQNQAAYEGRGSKGFIGTREEWEHEVTR
jgi:hypothetical protein